MFEHRNTPWYTLHTLCILSYSHNFDGAYFISQITVLFLDFCLLCCGGIYISFEWSIILTDRDLFSVLPIIE